MIYEGLFASFATRQNNAVILKYFFVTGMNKTSFDNIELQHSRNMIIIKDGNNLSLINTVRLNEEDLAELDACQVNSADFLQLKLFKFCHLLSAHGKPLFDNAKEYINISLDKLNSIK